jgi:hypothetical protein
MRDDDRFVWFGWMLRDHYNAVRAACERLSDESEPADRLRRLDRISHGADECVAVLDSMEPLFPAT